MESVLRTFKEIFGFSYVDPEWNYEEKKKNYSYYVEKTLPNGTITSKCQYWKTIPKDTDKLGDDVMILAPYLINDIRLGNADKLEILKELLKCEIHREVLHHEFITLLSEEILVENEIEVYINKCTELPNLYIDKFKTAFRENDTKGFPLYFVAQKFCNDQEACKERMKLLLKHNSDVNAHYHNEPTALHYAVQNDMWVVVKFLLDNEANADILINGETTRELRTKKNLDTPWNNSEEMIPYERFGPLFEALYNEDEAEFINLLQKNLVDIDNGRETLLQLAVTQKLETAVKALIEKGANVNKVSGCHTEPILLALRNPKFECLQLLLKCKDLNLRVAHSSETIFHEIAKISNINYKYKILLQQLIKKAISQGVSLHAENSKNQTAFDILFPRDDEDKENCNGVFEEICEENSAKIFACFFPFLDRNILVKIDPNNFSKMFDQHMSYENVKKENVVTLNYDFLKSDDIDFEPEMPILYQMSRIEQFKETIEHPLIKIFLINKLKKVSFVSVLHLIIYFLFVLTLTGHVYKITEWKEDVEELNLGIPADPNIDTTKSFNSTTTEVFVSKLKFILTFSYIIGGFFWFLIFIREVVEFWKMEFDYIRNTDNYLQIFVLVLSALAYIPPFMDISFIQGLAIVLAYLELTFVFDEFPFWKNTALYIEMFKRVTIQTILVLCTFMGVLFSFVFGFYVIFHDDDENNMKYFHRMWDSLLRTSGMAIGELNLGDIETHRDKGKEILLLIFIVFIPVVLVNLLNALAIIDTREILDEIESTCYIKKINYYAKIEAIGLGYKLHNYDVAAYPDSCCIPQWYKSKFVVFPNHSDAKLKFIKKGFKKYKLVDENEEIEMGEGMRIKVEEDEIDLNIQKKKSKLVKEKTCCIDFRSKASHKKKAKLVEKESCCRLPSDFWSEIAHLEKVVEKCQERNKQMLEKEAKKKYKLKQDEDLRKVKETHVSNERKILEAIEEMRVFMTK
ncbi:hypothetical protein B566_EDAN011252 [Ephemera danica]|nr:hypothetical protein B566_EDAN011252 [Ephemera danica]